VEQGTDLSEQGILLRHQRNAAWLADGGRAEAISIVMDSDGPSVALLGMSFLNRMDIRREGEIMTLTQRY